jgi:putative transposase
MCLEAVQATVGSSHVSHLAGKIPKVSDELWLVSFMRYDLGYFDDETCRLEPIANPFGAKVLPMSPE